MFIQFFCALAGAVISSIWTYYYGGNYWFIYPGDSNNDKGFLLQLALNTGVWFITLMNFVPVSLLLTLEMIN